MLREYLQTAQDVLEVSHLTTTNHTTESTRLPMSVLHCLILRLVKQHPSIDRKLFGAPLRKKKFKRVRVACPS